MPIEVVSHYRSALAERKKRFLMSVVIIFFGERGKEDLCFRGWGRLRFWGYKEELSLGIFEELVLDWFVFEWKKSCVWLKEKLCLIERANCWHTHRVIYIWGCIGKGFYKGACEKRIVAISYNAAFSAWRRQIRLVLPIKRTLVWQLRAKPFHKNADSWFLHSNMFAFFRNKTAENHVKICLFIAF